jgi:hypothetical protein
MNGARNHRKRGVLDTAEQRDEAEEVDHGGIMISLAESLSER